MVEGVHKCYVHLWQKGEWVGGGGGGVAQLLHPLETKFGQEEK